MCEYVERVKILRVNFFFFFLFFKVQDMDEVNKAESHLTSASAFVEGGIQDACDDSCSICLESFSDSDPSSVNGSSL